MKLVFLKLGGSLITDKRQEATARAEVIRRLGREIAEALAARPDLGLVLGHGSGSFGHVAAERSGFYRDRPSWEAFAQTGAAAARLNRLVVDLLLQEGVRAVSLQPSASAHCFGGELVRLDHEVIETLAVRAGCVPVVYGDVALDSEQDYAIVSTEQVFVYLAHVLAPARILLAGDVAGVFTADPGRDSAAQRISIITPATYPAIQQRLGGSLAVDVTGGMLTKVHAMVDIV